jgi:hypothetical protein
MAAKVFYLVRIEDETGVSGTGIVAEGVRWTDGSVSLRFVSKTPSFINFERVPEGVEINRIGERHVKMVHGHRGKTKVVWADDEEEVGSSGPPPPAPPNGEGDG